MRTKILAIAACVVLTTFAQGQVIGTPIHGLSPDNFSGTQAKSLDDYRGRLLLIEYFAYW